MIGIGDIDGKFGWMIGIELNLFYMPLVSCLKFGINPLDMLTWNLGISKSVWRTHLLIGPIIIAWPHDPDNH